MNTIKPDEIFFIEPINFQPLRLCMDDVLPVSMVLLLGYSYRLEPATLTKSLQSALLAFPHLSAQISFTLAPLKMELLPSDRKIELEWIKNIKADVQTLQYMEQESLLANFAPSASHKAQSPIEVLQAPLLQLRLSWLTDSDACVLGIMVSHIALDGIGLALFLKHLSTGLKGGGPSVVHDRKYTFPKIMPMEKLLPPFYHEIFDLPLAMMKAQNDQKNTQVTVFSVTVDNMEKTIGKKSLTNARFYLTAFLCQTLTKLQQKNLTIGLWCNTRGISHVPRNYSGNTGCYIHLPIDPEDLQKNYQLLKSTITRKGFSHIIDSYSQLKAAESEGRYIFWNGSEESLLSVNLVPHIPSAGDFGKGCAIYAQLLTRNVSGLRLYCSPNGKNFIVEACMPSQFGQGLMNSCESLGLSVQKWHQPYSRQFLA